METAEKTFFTTDGQEVTLAQIERIYGWARDKVCTEGTIIRNETHAWNTEVDRCLVYHGFTLIYTSGHSQFGGEDLGIWRGSKQGTRENALFFTYRSGLGEYSVSRLISLDTWLPDLDGDIVEWEKEQAAIEAQAAANAADMSLRRQEAAEWLLITHQVARIAWTMPFSELFLPGWAQDLQRYQAAGLLSTEETWESGRVVEVNMGGSMIYIHPEHPEYGRWQSLILGSTPKFDLADEPYSHILPPFARFLRFK